MNKRIIILLSIIFLSSLKLYSQSQFSSTNIKWKKNGVWVSNTYYPNSVVTITPDQGSPIDVTVTRTSNATVPVKFIVWDVGNYQTHVVESSQTSHLFTNCIGPLNTEIRIGVTSMVDFARIIVNWANPPTPDLTMSTILVDGSLSGKGLSWQVGQTVKIIATVFNVGGAEATSSRLGLYIKSSSGSTSGSPVSYKTAYSVRSGYGSQHEFTYTFTNNDIGERYFVFKADYANQVTEADENNNVKSFGPFTVLEPARLILLPATHSFGLVEANKCSAEKEFILVNNGGMGTSISAVSLGLNSHFEIVSGGGNFYLGAGESRAIKVKFCPKSAGSNSDILKIYTAGVSSPVVQSSISGSGSNPPEAIIANSPYFLFNTKTITKKFGGISLRIIETAGTNMVHSVGYERKKKTSLITTYRDTIKFEVDKDGYVFLSEGDQLTDGLLTTKIEDFADQILLFDINKNQIGHINFSYSFEWEGNSARHAIVFLHNDGSVFGGSINDDSRYFPYHRKSPSNETLAGLYVRYNYYQDGEYPVSMLIPPHFKKDEYNAEGYREPLNYDNVKPVLFIHGLTGTFSYQDEARPADSYYLGTESSYWYLTPIQLDDKLANNARKYHAWQYYYPNEDDLKHCGMMLDTAVNYLYKLYETPLNFVAHSMGTLVTMQYLTEPKNYSKEKIGKVLLSTPPIHGSYAANTNYRTPQGWFVQSFQDGAAPCYRDLSVGSDFLTNLHKKEWPQELCNNTFVVVGLTPKDYKNDILFIGDLNPFTNLHLEAYNHSDGVVSYSSASLVDKGIGFLGIHGNHDDGKYSKTLSDPNFWPNLIDAYVSDTGSNNEQFEKYCLSSNQPLIEIFVRGDKNVLKPSGYSIKDLTSNHNDVDFKKGMVTLRSEFINEELHLNLWYQKSINKYKLLQPLSLPPTNAIELGYFSKNFHSGLKDDKKWYNYYFNERLSLKYSGIGFPFTSINQAGCTEVIYTNNSLFPERIIGNICDLNLEHQYLIDAETPTKSAILASKTQSTPTKQIIQAEKEDPGTNFIYVDDQTTSAEFWIYGENAHDLFLPYGLILTSPTGAVIDSMSLNASYTRDTRTTVVKALVQNPVPGKWKVQPDIGSLNNIDLNFVTKGELVSEIVVNSLIPKIGYSKGSAGNLSGIVKVPDMSLLKSDSLIAYLKVINSAGIIDTVTLNNLHVADTGLVFSNSFSAITPGAHSYIMEVTGSYNAYLFERAVYGNFIVEDAQTTLFIPDVDMNIINRNVSLKLPDYLFCNSCDKESLEFEVIISESTFIDDDLTLGYDPEEKTLTISVQQESPLAEAGFTVKCYSSDSMIASTNFRINYTTPGVPVGLKASSITRNSAELGWIPKGTENNWDIIFGPAGFNPVSEGVLIEGVNDMPFKIEGLEQGKTYDFYVRAAFPENSTNTAWSWPGTFGTNFLITVESGANGYADPEGETEALNKGSLLVNFYPEDGYHVENVVLDGKSLGAIDYYQFNNITDNHTIDTHFGLNSYIISSAVYPSNAGTISGTGEFRHGENVELKAIPAKGYKFVNWIEAGIETSVSDSIRFNALANKTLIANFALSTYSATIKQNDFVVYPNPTDGKLKIELKGGGYLHRLCLYNIMGQKLIDVNANQESHYQLDISGFTPGVYLIQLVTDNGIYSRKIQLIQ